MIGVRINGEKFEDYISQAQAARMRAVTRQAINDLIKRGRLRSVRLGGRSLVLRSEIEDFIELAKGRPQKNPQQERLRPADIEPDIEQPLPIPPAASATRPSENFRARSVATRLTAAEGAEVNTAAAHAGQKVGEWLREAALAQARSVPAEKTDRILLAELIAMRALLLNLLSAAFKDPSSDEPLRTMLVYANSIKQHKADEVLAQLKAGNGTNPCVQTAHGFSLSRKSLPNSFDNQEA